MAIEIVGGPKSLPTGFLEVDPKWLASLWGLQTTGEVRVVLGKILVAVQHPTLTPNQTIVGNLAMAFLPTGFSAKVPQG